MIAFAIALMPLSSNVLTYVRKTILIDLEKSKLIGIMPARTQEEISQVLRGWGKEVKRVNRRSKYRLVERLQKFSNGTKAECSSSC